MKKTITFELTTEEAEELYYAIDERESALRCEYRDPSASPECRRVQKEHFELSHSLRLRMEQELKGQSTSPAPSSYGNFPADAVNEFYDLVYRSFGSLPQAAGRNYNNKGNECAPTQENPDHEEIAPKQ